MKYTFENLIKNLLTFGLILALISLNIVTAQAAPNNNGWVLNNGSWCYYTNGIKKTGWLNNSGTWYYLNSNGNMTTGWLLDNGAWYYLNSGGDMKTGWLQYGGNLYYLNPNGTMAKNTTIEGKTIKMMA